MRSASRTRCATGSIRSASRSTSRATPRREAARARRAGEGPFGGVRHRHERRRGARRDDGVNARTAPGTLCAGRARPRRSTRARIDTLIVGAGQAGARPQPLPDAGRHEHVLLERGRVGQRWHERWDSLTLLSPNWMNGFRAPRARGHGRVSRPLGVPRATSRTYAHSFAAPVVEGVEVERGGASRSGFRVDDERGCLARPQSSSSRPAMPTSRTCRSQLRRASALLHASEYRRPELLPDGPRPGRRSRRERAAARSRAARGGAGRRPRGRPALARTAHDTAGRDIFEWAPTARRLRSHDRRDAGPRGGEARAAVSRSAARTEARISGSTASPRSASRSQDGSLASTAARARLRRRSRGERREGGRAAAKAPAPDRRAPAGGRHGRRADPARSSSRAGPRDARPARARGDRLGDGLPPRLSVAARRRRPRPRR